MLKQQTSIYETMRVWLRHETKGVVGTETLHIYMHSTVPTLLAHEQRVTITPETAKALLESGVFEALHVERSPTRIFPDSAYEEQGCILEEKNAWMQLPRDDNLLIVGLKELLTSAQPVMHKHAYFAHVFKEQDGWRDVLQRYAAGGGVIYDYEYLHNPAGLNIGAAMSPFAGFVGCAVGLRAWCAQQLGEPMSTVAVSTKAKLCDALQALLLEVKASKVQMLMCINCIPMLYIMNQGVDPPSVLVMGALGRCGGGAVECATRLGLEVRCAMLF